MLIQQEVIVFICSSYINYVIIPSKMSIIMIKKLVIFKKFNTLNFSEKGNLFYTFLKYDIKILVIQ